eukprot:3481557-Prymnesium_polylepis.4
MLPSDIDFGDRRTFGGSALIYAVKNERVNAVRFLIDHNASVKARNWFGFTPLIRSSPAAATQTSTWHPWRLARVAYTSQLCACSWRLAQIHKRSDADP